MKGTYFSKSLEWNIETYGESWEQGGKLHGQLRLKNHGTEKVSIINSGVGLSVAEIKKVQSKVEGILNTAKTIPFSSSEICPNEELKLDFEFDISDNDPITDKKSSFYLIYGSGFQEAQLQVKVLPKAIYSQVANLLNTFHKFVIKEIKSSKKGVEFKFSPPSSREMANLDSLIAKFSMDGETLLIKFNFSIKKLDTSATLNKVVKEEIAIEKSLSPKEYSFGKNLLNQDNILKLLAETLDEIKLRNIF